MQPAWVFIERSVLQSFSISEEMDIIKRLQDPEHVAKIQRFLGVYPVLEHDDLVDGKASKANDCNGLVSHRDGELLSNSFLDKRHKDEYSQLKRNGNSNLIAHSDKHLSARKCNGSNNSSNGKFVTSEHDKPVRYTVKYTFLHCFFSVASLLGHEPFYLLFYPLFGWNFDFHITRRTAVLWGVVMYTGQAAKDIIRSPRPGFPPVVPLETQHLLEYGMPSTHAMAGTAMPFTLMYLISSRYEVPVTILVFIAVAWCGLVCFSRLYLGVHTIGDVAVGVVCSVLILCIFLPLMEAFDLFVQTNVAAPLILLVIAVALCTKIYPKGAHSAQSDATVIVAVIYGMTLGAWLNYQLGIVAIPIGPVRYRVPFPTWQWAALSLLRFLIGASLVGVCKVLLKKVTLPLASWLLGYRSGKADDHTIKLTYRFLIYVFLGVLIIHIIPILFGSLNIDRVGFYVEG